MILRKKVSVERAKILDRLARKYESEKERIRRINEVLNVMLEDKQISKFKAKKLMNKPYIDITKLKQLVKEQNTGKALETIGNSTRDGIDIKLYNGSIARVFRRGTKTEKVFAIIKKDGKRWIMRHAKAGDLDELGGQNWKWIADKKTGKTIWNKDKNSEQEAKKIYPFAMTSRKEEYCGPDLYNLENVATSWKEIKFIDDLMDKIKRKYPEEFSHKGNITYNPKTKELIIIDLK